MRRDMAPKIKIEDILPSGEKISIVLESPNLSEKRVTQILEMIKLMGAGKEEITEENRSLKNTLWRIILDNFGDGTWFSIRDLYNVARKELPEIKVTSISTYIIRFVNEGKLRKRGTRPNTRYRVSAIYVKSSQI